MSCRSSSNLGFVEKVSYIRASTCEEVIDAEDFMPEQK